MSTSRAVKGDYIGFTFGDVHSSELGLVRVSDGSRYNSDLLPPLQDSSVQVAGRDGEVLFGTTYKAKEIRVPVAFDNLTEKGFRDLTRLLADKKPKSLWFDESPYKEWIVKSANVQDFKWVCFDGSRGDSNAHEKKRIYKGEGTIVFKCFSPYAQSRVTYLDDPVPYVYVKDGHRIIKTDNITTFSIYHNLTPTRLYKISENLYYEKNTGQEYDFSDLNKTNQDFLSKKENGSIGYVLAQFLPEAELYKNAFFISAKVGEEIRNEIVNEVYVINDFSQLNFDIDNTYWIATNAIHLLSGEKRNLSFYHDATSNGIQFVGTWEDETGIGDVCLLILENNSFFWIDPKAFTENEDINNFTNCDRYEFSYISKKNFDQVTLQDNYNFEEWKEASGLVLREEREVLNSKELTIHNSGDIEADFKMIFEGTNVYVRISDQNNEDLLIFLIPTTAVSSNYIEFDSKMKLLKGLDENKKPNGHVYNNYIKKGDFFKLPCTLPQEDFKIKFTQSAYLPKEISHKHYYI